MDFGTTRYSITQTLNAGPNEIPFESFNEVPRGTATVNVTGLSAHNGWEAVIDLGFASNSPRGMAMVASGSASIAIDNVFPGTYDVLLTLFDPATLNELLFFAESRSFATTGTNNIPFSVFSPFDFDQDEIRVFVTGLTNLSVYYMALVDPVIEATIADGTSVLTFDGTPSQRFILSDGIGNPAPTGSYLVVLHSPFFGSGSWLVSTAAVPIAAGEDTELDIGDFESFTGFSAGLEPFERAMLQSRAGAEARASRARR